MTRARIPRLFGTRLYRLVYTGVVTDENHVKLGWSATRDVGAFIVAGLDEAFGPGAGEGGIEGCQFQRDNVDKITMWADMTPVPDKPSVQITRIAN